MRTYVEHQDQMEPMTVGFYNGGQKAMFWEIVCGCVAYVITGVIMWFPEIFGRILVSISYVVHDISALIMLFGIFFHVYLSTFGEPGTIQAMTQGTVSKEWAWTHHPAWYKQMTGRDPYQDMEAERERLLHVTRTLSTAPPPPALNLPPEPRPMPPSGRSASSWRFWKK
jgi:cytochrome b subunit of formate dehydrogenase